MMFSASTDWNQRQAVGGDSAAKHQLSILWGPATVMSLPLGSVEGQGGRGQEMRAERDNVMERKQQNW